MKRYLAMLGVVGIAALGSVAPASAGEIERPLGGPQPAAGATPSCTDYWINGRGDCDGFLKLCDEAGGSAGALVQWDDWTGGSTTYTCNLPRKGS